MSQNRKRGTYRTYCPMTRMGMIADLLKDKGSMFRNDLISLINR